MHIHSCINSIFCLFVCFFLFWFNCYCLPAFRCCNNQTAYFVFCSCVWASHLLLLIGQLITWYILTTGVFLYVSKTFFLSMLLHSQIYKTMKKTACTCYTCKFKKNESGTNTNFHSDVKTNKQINWRKNEEKNKKKNLSRN